jgi:hypothetical protein
VKREEQLRFTFYVSRLSFVGTDLDYKVNFCSIAKFELFRARFLLIEGRQLVMYAWLEKYLFLKSGKHAKIKVNEPCERQALGEDLKLR